MNNPMAGITVIFWVFMVPILVFIFAFSSHKIVIKSLEDKGARLAAETRQKIKNNSIIYAIIAAVILIGIMLFLFVMA